MRTSKANYVQPAVIRPPEGELNPVVIRMKPHAKSKIFELAILSAVYDQERALTIYIFAIRPLSLDCCHLIIITATGYGSNA